jgi:2-polyprenyl-6-methoxyphenol hydroxylase-like FAD-dependent oxidoreductase
VDRSSERILVVGGGIAGLATAVGLARAGLSCEVIERADRWAPVGAGIVLGVNAMRVTRGLGLGEAVAERGARLGAGAITDHRGRELGASDFRSLEAELGPTIALHRAALHDVLLAGAAGVPISLGTTVDRVDQRGEHVEVRLSDGREERYALVIGADGIRSQVRGLTFGDVPLVYSGYTCWRLVVSLPTDDLHMREMWGRGQRFGVVPIGEGQVYCFAVANAPRGELDAAPPELERFCERFAGFGGQVPRILSALEKSDDLIHNDLEELPVCPWYDGRVVLIGDAAHAMTPNMGQGAAMALEDSMVLVELLASGAPTSEALASLVARRESRVRWVQQQSRRIGRVGQLEGAWACRLRNSVLRLVPNRANAGALRRLASQPI